MTSMTEVKTAELTGPALDWAVAHATKAWEWAHEWYPTMTLDPTFRGVSDNAPGGSVSLIPRNPMRQDSQPFTPSTDWAQGGRLIEQFTISFNHYCVGGSNPDGSLKDAMFACIGYRQTISGKNAEARAVRGDYLSAACRAIVIAKLGDIVSVPSELLP